jgi:DNA repair exonuclease SbcCD ATPase subunit
MDDVLPVNADAEYADLLEGDGGLDELAQFIHAHQERLQLIQQTLAEEIQKLAEEFDGEDIRAIREEVLAQKAEVEQKTERLLQLRAELETLQRQFAAAQEQMREEQQASHDRLQSWENDLLAKSAELELQEVRLREGQRELARMQEEFTHDAQQLARGRERLTERLRQLDEQHEKLVAERQQLLDEIERERKNHREERERLQAAAREAASGMAPEAAEEIASLREQLADLQTQLEERTTELLQRQAECRSLEEQLLAAAAADNEQMILELTDEVERLQARLADSSEQVKRLRDELHDAQASGDSALRQELDDLRDRYQMAVEDLRNERARSVALENKLANAKAGSPADSQGMDWESQKRRLLAALEADFDDDDEQALEDRITIEDVIRRTDAAIVEKERELAELREVLNQQSANLGNMAIGAAAIAEILDQDELILQERQNLEHLKKQLEEKYRQAEIELSMERAKIARERQELEEKMRSVEDELHRLRKNKPADDAAEEAGGKTQRGRWFKRLGLKDDDNQ